MMESDGASRQRLRPWLEAQLNSGLIPGLEWLNAEMTKFKISWRHAGKQGWNPACGQIFEEWAKHTGSYREGIDKPEYVKWKTRLRCALNKAQDIEYLEQESQTQENDLDPYRVYQFKPRTNRRNRTNNKSASCNNSNAICGQLNSAHYPPCQKQEAPVPKIVTDLNDEISCRLPSDLAGLDSAELRQFCYSETAAGVNVMEFSLQSMSSITMTSHDDKVTSGLPAMSIDIDQLTDNMSSITFDQTPLNVPTELSTANNAQKTRCATAAFLKDHLRDDLGDQIDFICSSTEEVSPPKVGKLETAGKAVMPTGGEVWQSVPQESQFFQPGLNPRNPGIQSSPMAVTQTSVSVVSMTGDSYSPPAITSAPSPVTGYCVETAASNEQYGLVDLQDMLTSDDF